MTEPLAKVRNRPARAWRVPLMLVLVLLLAAGLRLHGIGAGLPALNDPDEPLFMMTAVEMLRNRTFDPGWFGHPGTITLYSLALTSLAVAVLGLATGRFSDPDAFVAAVYADPGILFLPGRIVMAASGTLCVLLLFLIGRRIGGARLGLVAALLLAVNAVHVEYSQIIRTDVQASVFVLLATLQALSIVERGKRRDHGLAGLFTGLACATKWPAALVLLNPVTAAAARALGRGHGWGRVLLVPIAAAIALVAASPFLLLDYPTVLANLSGEARPLHPGSTGGGFLANLLWYITHPLHGSLGGIGLLLAAVGAVWMPIRNRAVRLAVLPFALAFPVVIAGQALLWERWIVPVLPFAALAAAYALCGAADRLGRALERPGLHIHAPAAALLAVGMAQTSLIETRERLHDTRQAASQWVRTHVPPGSTILIEDAAFDIIHGPWRFRFPMGSAGCIDVAEALAGRIRYSNVEEARAGSPLVDLGHVDPAQLDSCRTDFAILTHYDRYADGGQAFRPQFERYDRLLAGARVHAVIRPVPGESSGPNVFLVALAPRE